MFGAISSVLVGIVPGAFAAIAALLVVVGTAAAIGPLALLSVALFLISACALGSKLLRTGDDVSAENQIYGTLLGMAVYIFAMTFLARLPVNYPAVYLVLLAIPVAMDIRGVRRRLASWIGALRPSRPHPRLQVAPWRCWFSCWACIG